MLPSLHVYNWIMSQNNIVSMGWFPLLYSRPSLRSVINQFRDCDLCLLGKLVVVKRDPKLIEKFDGIDIECFETDTTLMVSSYIA